MGTSWLTFSMDFFIKRRHGLYDRFLNPTLNQICKFLNDKEYFIRPWKESSKQRARLLEVLWWIPQKSRCSLYSVNCLKRTKKRPEIAHFKKIRFSWVRNDLDEDQKILLLKGSMYSVRVFSLLMLDLAIYKLPRYIVLFLSLSLSVSLTRCLLFLAFLYQVSFSHTHSLPSSLSYTIYLSHSLTPCLSHTHTHTLYICLRAIPTHSHHYLCHTNSSWLLYSTALSLSLLITLHRTCNKSITLQTQNSYILRK